jgi:hypothetical protein
VCIDQIDQLNDSENIDKVNECRPDVSEERVSASAKRVEACRKRDAIADRLYVNRKSQ